MDLKGNQMNRFKNYKHHIYLFTNTQIFSFALALALALANALKRLCTWAIDRPRKNLILPPTTNRLEKLIVVVFQWTKRLSMKHKRKEQILISSCNNKHWTALERNEIIERAIGIYLEEKVKGMVAEPPSKRPCVELPEHVESENNVEGAYLDTDSESESESEESSSEEEL